MIAHDFPCIGVASSMVGHGVSRAAGAASCSSGPAAAVPTPDEPGRVNKGRHGPPRVPLHVASGCEGAGGDPGLLPRGPRPRWVLGPLLLPHAPPAGARRPGACPA